MVNKSNALGLSAVWSCVKVISETVASLPLEVILDDGINKTKAKDHYLYNLLNAEPSELYTSYVMKETIQGHLCLDGNGYLRIHRSPNGRVLEFEIYQPFEVDPQLIEGKLWYKLSKKDKPFEVVDAWDMIHIPAFGFDGLKGKNPIAVQRENLGTGIATQTYGNNFFKKGAHVSGAVKFPQKLTQDQKTGLSNQLENKYSGLNNVGKTLILDMGMEYQSIGIKPADAMFIENRKLTVEEVARIFRVPLHLLAAMDKATYNNVEQLNINFLQYTIYPWVKRWEQEINRKVFTAAERLQGYKVKFNLNSLLRGDSAARAKFYRELFTIQAISPNEIRSLENMNPYEGGDQYGLPLASNIKTDETQEQQTGS